MSHHATKDEFSELEDTLTVTECAEMFGVRIGTVRDAINCANIAARQSGNIWIISRRSAVRWFEKREK